MKINYTYKIPFRPLNVYKWGPKGCRADTTSYEPVIWKQLPHIVDQLKADRSTRQAIIIVNSFDHEKDERDFNSCCISIQFQIMDEVLYVTANYRSQCEIYGRPGDSKMILYLTELINKAVGRFKEVDITVNVGNYHRSETII